MAHRKKHIKRIDPKYFLHETVNRRERRYLKEQDEEDAAADLIWGSGPDEPDIETDWRTNPEQPDVPVLDPDAPDVTVDYTDPETLSPDELDDPRSGPPYSWEGYLAAQGEIEDPDPDEPGYWPIGGVDDLDLSADQLDSILFGLDEEEVPRLESKQYLKAIILEEFRKVLREEEARYSAADPDVLISPGPDIPGPVTGEPMPGTGGSRFSYEGDFGEPEHVPYESDWKVIRTADEVAQDEKSDEESSPPTSRDPAGGAGEVRLSQDEMDALYYPHIDPRRHMLDANEESLYTKNLRKHASDRGITFPGGLEGRQAEKDYWKDNWKDLYKLKEGEG